MNKKHLDSIASVEKISFDSYIIDVTIDQNKEILILAQEKIVGDKIEKYNEENLKDIYNIYKVSENKLEKIFTVENLKTSFHYIRKVDNDRYLLSSARCYFYSEDNIEKNSYIVNKNGIIESNFILGDGINDIKIENNKKIWTSYFDEGVFGNYGWTKPLGSSGLRCWSLNGESLYEYEATEYDYSISDCYAFNISKKGDKWFYFYTEFYLCKLNEGEKKYYTIDVSGTHVLAVCDKFILTDSGYGQDKKYILYEENDDKFLKKLEYKVYDRQNEKELKARLIQHCENKIVFIAEDKIYCFEIEEILKEFNIR